jgi:hypothetical protein
MWTRWLKSPALQAGYRGFESRHRYHWPEARKDERAILNRQEASSILARPTKFGNFMPGNSAGCGDWFNTPAQLSSILSPGTKL